MNLAVAEDQTLLTPIRRLRLGEYHEMIERGILDEDEHVELLEGVLVEMSPQSGLHSWAINQLMRQMGPEAQRLGWGLRVQMPLTLERDDSEPEPDLAVVSLEGERSALPGQPKTALLVVESARNSLRKDRHLKGRLYARAAIPEYWIVDLEHRQVEVYRDPDGSAGSYRTLQTLTVADTLRFGELAIPVVALFP